MTGGRPEPARLLILGGTGEARQLAEAAVRCPGLSVTTSLAGRTRHPRLPPGRVRIGGFGGPEGLTDFLLKRSIAAVVDATHPFAERIGRHTRLACARAARPLLILQRPAWPDGLTAGAAFAVDLGDALHRLRHVPGRTLITFNTDEAGPAERACLRQLAGVGGLVVRSLGPPGALPVGAVWVPFRQGDGVEDERQMFRARGITGMVGKASGGTATAGKLVAARNHGVAVVLIQRPAPMEGLPVAGSVGEALAWALAQRPAVTAR